jgi:microsomal dipeptidase-like Zn-dependent dipeptidase
LRTDPRKGCHVTASARTLVLSILDAAATGVVHAGDTFPIGMQDVSQYPNLIAELLRCGYREGDVRKICGENLLRVWSAVERVAAQEGSIR